MWTALRSLRKRWKANKHNKPLRKKIAELTQKTEKYATELATTRWGQMCDNLRGTLSMKRTWSLLRHLLDPSQSKTAQTNRMTQLIHSYPGTQQQLLINLKEKYFPTGEQHALPEYRGAPNTLLDADITEAEVRAALVNLKTTSAPGKDGVTNKMLRNLDDNSVTTLTLYFNQYWNAGTLPKTWTHANISLLPKPGKPLSIDHLRPIPPTSCIGKLLEHIIHARLIKHINKRNSLPSTMFGFRAGLSTNDVHLQLHHDVIATPPQADTAAILALDLTKAFDKVTH